MSALLVSMLVACPGTEPVDSPPISADSGEDTGDIGGDTGTVDDGCEPVDLCGNDLDDDCDGATDEGGCAAAYLTGTTDHQRLGDRLAVAASAPAYWLTTVRQRTESAPAIFGLARSGDSLEPTWSQTADSVPTQVTGGLDLRMHEGAAFLAYVVSSAQPAMVIDVVDVEAPTEARLTLSLPELTGAATTLQSTPEGLAALVWSAGGEVSWYTKRRIAVVWCRGGPGLPHPPRRQVPRRRVRPWPRRTLCGPRFRRNHLLDRRWHRVQPRYLAPM